MKNPNYNKEVKRRERLLELYVEGFDERNDAKIAFVLAAALDDAELDRKLDEINSAFVEEIGLSEFGELPAAVRELAREHLPSAFAAEEEQPPRALTVGDVAKQLEINRNVPRADAEINRALLENRTLLPKTMSFEEIKRLANELKIAASNLFWRKFHGAAMTLRAARSEEMALFAARQKRLKKQRGEKDDKRGNETKNQ